MNGVTQNVESRSEVWLFFWWKDGKERLVPPGCLDDKEKYEKAYGKKMKSWRSLVYRLCEKNFAVSLSFQLSKQAKERNAPLKKKKISEIHQKKFPQASAKKTFRWKTCGTKAREAKDDDSNDGDGAGDGGCSDGGGGGGGASAAAPVADNRNEWKLAQGEK